jgi:hypothetical protein
VTTWTFKKKPKSNNILILKKEVEQPRVLLGELDSLHAALTEVANRFEPGDIILTPEGNCIMTDLMGELNN